MMRTVFVAALLVVASSFSSVSKAASPTGSELRLTLPPVLYAVAGDETAIYFDNVVLTEQPEDYEFTVNCDLGKTEQRRWVAAPAQDQVGDHPLQLTVRRGGKKLAEGSLTLKVLPADAGGERSLTLLIVGDSLTHATQYPNEIARLLSRPGNPQWTMLGTHRPSSAAEGVAHEGYGGWTWERFVNLYSAQPAADKRQNRSPFVYAENGQPTLDMSRYLEETAGGRKPDCVTFLLGINDCFSANPDDSKAIDERIDNVFKQAETLLAAFRQAAPNADLGICLTTPPNARESGFEANYKGRYHRWAGSGFSTGSSSGNSSILAAARKSESTSCRPNSTSIRWRATPWITASIRTESVTSRSAPQSTPGSSGARLSGARLNRALAPVYCLSKNVAGSSSDQTSLFSGWACPPAIQILSWKT